MMIITIIKYIIIIIIIIKYIYIIRIKIKKKIIKKNLI